MLQYLTFEGFFHGFMGKTSTYKIRVSEHCGIHSIKLIDLELRNMLISNSKYTFGIKMDISYTSYKPLALTVKKALLTFLTPNKSLNSLVVAMIFLRSEVHSLG